MIRVSFLDFWDGFDENNNFFIHLLKNIKENIIISSPDKADIIFFSCFGNTHYNFSNCKKIFFTGENIRPDYNICDYSLTFDFDSYGGKNIRLPLWYLYIDWFNVNSYTNPNWLIPVEYLYIENEFIKKKKTKFCCTVFSRYIENRHLAINYLNNYKTVDCYGKLPNFINIPEGEKQKLDILSNYKFSLCFENSDYTGYFTEKLLHAKVAGNIPLYYSNVSFDKDFNKDCCLNLSNYTTMEHFISDIKEIDQNITLYNNMVKSPIFTKIPNISNIIDSIRKIV